MATDLQPSPLSLDRFLQPLHVDVQKCHLLAEKLCTVFISLARESQAQFLPTPVSDSVLRPEGDGQGKYLAIDIGGTNLRVGFIELLGTAKLNVSEPSDLKDLTPHSPDGRTSRAIRHLEKSWPIGEHLKNNQADDLFSWIGECISEVVKDGIEKWPGEMPNEIPLGVTFSFPMIQHTLSDATLMAMGKDFTITEKLNLGQYLLKGYERCRDELMPRIQITAIVNDAVATLVSFAYQLRKDPRRKAAMGLIVGTGTNATIPLALSKLHPSKRPASISLLTDSGALLDTKIAVNTEWTIKGAAPPLHELGLVTRWDAKLDAEGLAPGFQPFEYMTAGRYLGELGRIIAVDYFTNCLSIPEASLPPGLTRRYGLTTTFLGKVRPGSDPDSVKNLTVELSPASDPDAFQWTAYTADIIFRIAKAIQARGSGMTAAAILGLLGCADEIDLFSSKRQVGLPNGVSQQTPAIEELLVGYTGGCISHFQDYLTDCQQFLDEIMAGESGKAAALRVVLQPCHDGGILGAGILAGTVKNMANHA